MTCVSISEKSRLFSISRYPVVHYQSIQMRISIYWPT